MKKTMKIDQTIAELRRQLEAAEADRKAAEKAEQRALEQAKKYASDNHSRTVLALYDELGIDAEHQRPRRVNDQVRYVATDRDETHRTRRLLTYVRALREAADPDLLEELTRADQDDRDERKPTPVPVATETAAEPVAEPAESAPAASADEAATDPVGAAEQPLRRSWHVPYDQAA